MFGRSLFDSEDKYYENSDSDGEVRIIYCVFFLVYLLQIHALYSIFSRSLFDSEDKYNENSDSDDEVCIIYCVYFLYIFYIFYRFTLYILYLVDLYSTQKTHMGWLRSVGSIKL